MQSILSLEMEQANFMRFEEVSAVTFIVTSCAYCPAEFDKGLVKTFRM